MSYPSFAHPTRLSLQGIRPRHLSGVLVAWLTCTPREPPAAARLVRSRRPLTHRIQAPYPAIASAIRTWTCRRSELPASARVSDLQSALVKEAAPAIWPPDRVRTKTRHRPDPDHAYTRPAWTAPHPAWPEPALTWSKSTPAKVKPAISLARTHVGPPPCTCARSRQRSRADWITPPWDTSAPMSLIARHPHPQAATKIDIELSPPLLRSSLPSRLSTTP